MKNPEEGDNCSGENKKDYLTCTGRFLRHPHLIFTPEMFEPQLLVQMSSILFERWTSEILL